MAAATKKKAEWSATCQAIIDGKHDDDLAQILRAAEWRRKVVVQKSGIRKNAKVRMKADPRSGEFAGREGVVTKINKTRVSVDFKCRACGESKPSPEGKAFEDECQTCYGVPEGLLVPPDLLEVIA